jgi:hypothetical protein
VRARGLVAASLALAVPVLAGGCGSSNSGGATVPAAFCQRTLAVLSDGPDPGADPVGYALSQIQPLSQIRAPDHGLSVTLADLITADRALVASQGKDHAATAAIARADAALNVACPGVAP